jgi:hypothetical protein
MLSKSRSVDQQMREGCAVSFHRLKTNRRMSSVLLCGWDSVTTAIPVRSLSPFLTGRGWGEGRGRLRPQAGDAGTKLWFALRNRRLGRFRFVRQKGIRSIRRREFCL